MPRKFKHWAYLNPEGMEMWAQVFPDRKVPVLSMIPTIGPLGTPDNIEEYFKVYWDELTEVQIVEIYSILCKKFKAEKYQISEQLRAFGMPLRKCLTNGSGTNHPGLFI